MDSKESRLNLIENVRFMMKTCVSKSLDPPQNLAGLEKLLMEAWNDTVNVDYCEKLYCTMPFRLGAIFDNCGARCRC